MSLAAVTTLIHALEWHVFEKLRSQPQQAIREIGGGKKTWTHVFQHVPFSENIDAFVDYRPAEGELVG